MRQITHIGSAVLLLHGQPKQAQLTQLGPECVGKGILLICQISQRCNLLGREPCRELPQLVDLFAKVEIK